jgi:phage-related holin
MEAIVSKEAEGEVRVRPFSQWYLIYELIKGVSNMSQLILEVPDALMGRLGRFARDG